MRTKITKTKKKELKKKTLEHFPDYTTFIINRASETAQATRPNIVGKMTELFEEFTKQSEMNSTPITLESWQNFYTKEKPYAIQNATEKAWSMVLNFKSAIELIDYHMVEEWISDLILKKTFFGLNNESLIRLHFKDKGLDVRNSNSQEESQNIDLFIEDKPYQIKPISYKNERSISDRIEIPIIFYENDDSGAIYLEFDDEFLISKL